MNDFAFKNKCGKYLSLECDTGDFIVCVSSCMHNTLGGNKKREEKTVSALKRLNCNPVLW